jgi:hypothetical protein
MNTAHSVTGALAKGLGLVLVAAGLLLHPAYAASAGTRLSGPSRPMSSVVPVAVTAEKPVLAIASSRAHFGREEASPEARHFADWVLDSGDNRGTPFAIVDKVDSKVFVFDAHGRLRGASSALVGLAPGDDSVPGIGNRKISTIRPEERTTPAGRFVASLERSAHGDEILWVDYDAAVALHQVIVIPNERRLERLASPVPQERRITYGCINVPVKFFKDVVSPLFRGTSGIVYVLPETRSSHAVFGSYDVEGDATLRSQDPRAGAKVGSP